MAAPPPHSALKPETVMTFAADVFAPNLFAGKTYLISGAGGGVGSATARLLHSLGARLALTDIAGEALQKTALPLDALALVGDISSVAACEEIVARTQTAFGRLDGLVNAAGIWVEGPSHLASEAEYDRCLAVNLKGTFFLCSRAIPALAATTCAPMLNACMRRR